VSSQNYLTDVGSYTSALSPYGTFDQGGDVFERNESLINGSFRGLRGGSWFFLVGFLHASSRIDGIPTSQLHHVGFRVASIPEPGTLLLAALAGMGLLWRRRALT
jgi:formylglycine-generating enzyme required for sulfatase activity